MNLNGELTNFAEQKLREHGLWEKGWRFEFCRAKRFLGFCKYRRQRIYVSYFYLKDDQIEVLKNTILHEIAHALAGSGAGHGPLWKQKCAITGAKPERCCSVDVKSTAEYRWTGTCTMCNNVVDRTFRKRKHASSSYHTSCGPSGRITYKCIDTEQSKLMAQRAALTA